jgi:hypothetical protein
MRANHATAAIPIVVAMGMIVSTGTLQAQANPAHTHVGHVASGFPAAPEGRGLLPVAVAEADVAIQHAGFAMRDPANLDAMKMHAGHVLHAIDPTQAPSGPGLGFGVKQAAQGVAQHVGLAASAQGASAAVGTHAGHITASATTVVQRADRIAELARQIQASTTAAQAAPLVQELQTVAQQLKTGRDADGNGTVGWQEGEGGLDQATQHLGLLRTAEGL